MPEYDRVRWMGLRNRWEGASEAVYEGMREESRVFGNEEPSQRKVGHLSSHETVVPFAVYCRRGSFMTSNVVPNRPFGKEGTYILMKVR